MMNQQQSAVPQELAALMALQEGIQAGKVMPTTPQGTPTVAAQMAQSAEQQMAPPAMEDVAQQAGIAAQLQQMQQEQMQQAMMQQAAQQAPQGGVAGLNSGVGGFADGGIVGYQEGGVSQEFGDISSVLADPSAAPPESLKERRRREEAEARMEFLEKNAPEVAAILKAEARQAAAPAPAPDPAAEVAKILAAPPPAAAPSGPSSGGPKSQLALVSAALDEYLKEAAAFKPKVPTLADAAAKGAELAAARDAFLRARGSDPDLLMKEAAELEKYYGKGIGQLEARKAEIEGRSPREGLIRRLLGARGRTFGSAMGSMAETGMAYDEGVRQQLGRLDDLKMQMEGLKLEKIGALKRMKFATDTGDFNAGREEAKKAADIDNAEKSLKFEIKRTEAQLRMPLAQMEESRAARQAAAGQAATGQMYSRLTAAQNGYTNAKDKWDKATMTPIIKAGDMAGGRDKLPSDQRAAYDNAMQKRQAAYERDVAPFAAVVDQLSRQVIGIPASAPSAAPMYASNPKTGQRIMSTDGGKTWKPVSQ
jgi:hypothetical protein